MSNRRRSLLSTGSGGLLPPEYQQVEYLESTGTQYIKTPFTGESAGDKIELDIQYTSTSESQYTGRKKTIGECVFIYQGYIAARFGYYTEKTIPVDTTRHSITMIPDAKLFIIDSASYTVSFTNEPFNGTYFTLFANHDGSKVNFQASCKIFKATFYEFNTEDSEYELQYDFIPCYRKSDNKPGVYDIVNGVFYTNQGTGEFIVGPNV